MKLIRKFRGEEKQVIHQYSASPKKYDLKGELNKFQLFKVWLLKAVGIGAEHYLAKVAIPRLKMENLILDNELKRRELKKMEDTVEEVRIYQEIDEVEGKVYTEEDVQTLLEELLELRQELKVVHGATIEHEEIDKEEKETKNPERILWELFTDAEIDIIQSAAKGNNTVEIASELIMTASTVYRRSLRILKKARNHFNQDFRNLTEFLAYCQMNGMI